MNTENTKEELRKDLQKLIDHYFRSENIDEIDEEFDEEIRWLYEYWDKGDCSEVGMVKLLLIRAIREYQKTSHSTEHFKDLLTYLLNYSR